MPKGRRKGMGGRTKPAKPRASRTTPAKGGARDRALAEAREQQTATSEILAVIARSRTDAQPVFDAVARQALRLCDALFSGVFRYDGQLIHHVAHHSRGPDLAAVLAGYPVPVSRDTATAQAIRE